MNCGTRVASILITIPWGRIGEPPPPKKKAQIKSFITVKTAMTLQFKLKLHARAEVNFCSGALCVVVRVGLLCLSPPRVPQPCCPW